jgi:hypothetical protein
MEYDDFVVTIDRDAAQELVVKVLSSPAGEGSGPFIWPGALREPATLRRPLALGLCGVGASGEALNREVQARQGSLDGPDPRKIGSALYQALFAGKVGSLFDESRGHAESAERGLRIKLRMDLHRPELTWLASLPWELLYRAETREYLALNLASPIVRYLDLPRGIRAGAFTPPLRVLALMANPEGMQPLDLQAERRKLMDAVGGKESVEVVFVERASLEGTRRQLRASGPFHLVHFMGHGAYAEGTGWGNLVFDDGQGKVDLVAGEVFATVLKPAMPQVVVLNACESARSTSGEGEDSFVGVATALVMAGASAVVAMQFPISDKAAIAFSDAFYERIASGDPVDSALSDARVAIQVACRGSIEWATPTLFMRTPDGRLFSEESVASRMSPDLPAGRQTKPAGRLTKISVGTIQGDMNVAEGDMTINRK